MDSSERKHVVGSTRPCDQCETPYVVNRSWQGFCGDHCRNRWHYLERKKAMDAYRASRKAKAP